MLDNTVIRFDPSSYDEMNMDNKKDMENCKTAWLKKLRCEWKSRGIERDDYGAIVKRQKTSTYHDDLEKEEKVYVKEEKEKKPAAKEDIEKRTSVEESTDSALVKQEEKERVAIGEVECMHCREAPCVWLEKKDLMSVIDQHEHRNLPDVDKPPNNTRRKKVYRQMTYIMNNGPMGKGVRKKLPKCVENGARALFPSPSFMGFKTK